MAPFQYSPLQPDAHQEGIVSHARVLCHCPQLSRVTQCVPASECVQSHVRNTTLSRVKYSKNTRCNQDSGCNPDLHHLLFSVSSTLCIFEPSVFWCVCKDFTMFHISISICLSTYISIYIFPHFFLGLFVVGELSLKVSPPSAAEGVRCWLFCRNTLWQMSETHWHGKHDDHVWSN